MNDKPSQSALTAEHPPGDAVSAYERLPIWAHYALAAVYVAIATLFAFAIQSVASQASTSLMFVVPVVIVATLSPLGATVMTIAICVLSYDFFFTEPYYSLTIASPQEIWSAILLALIAAVVASVAATSRRRAVSAARLRRRAEAIQMVAHFALHASSYDEVLKAAIVALDKLFRSPIVLLRQQGDELNVIERTGRAAFQAEDRDAALGAASLQMPTRADIYPFYKTRYDFWPFNLGDGEKLIVGIDFTRASSKRLGSPGKAVEAVAGYLLISRHNVPSSPSSSRA